MTYIFPKYVNVPGIQSTPIHYTWDDWNVEDADLPLDDAVQTQLSHISHRAIMAFTIATSEWIVYRFDSLMRDPMPTQRLEAAWAQICHFQYSYHEDISRDVWNGPVRGPVRVAMRRVVFAIQQSQSSDDPAWRAGRASKLAEHVIADPKPYQDWRESILSRFEKLYPLDPDVALGEVIPREALDPSVDFYPSATETLINQFLSQLDHQENPFLNSPKRMIELGFKGTPYTFDIERERRDRLDW